MKKYLILLGIIFLIVSLAAFYIHNDIKNMSDSDTEASSFTQCAKLKSSIVVADYPNASCTTKSGQVFKEVPTSYIQENSQSTGSSSINKK